MSFTVAVLNYNYERYLRDAVDSALAQTHPDVQVVVVDDGSTDGSVDVIRGYGSRVTAVCKPNGGQGSAMNAAFAVATGDVVLFLDADDLLEPQAAAAVAPRFTEDVAWVMFRLAIVDGEGRLSGRVRPHREGVMPDADLRAHLGRYRCFHWQPTSGNAFARHALERVLPVPEEDYRISADAYLASVVPLVGAVRSTDAVLGRYRVHARSNYTSARVDDAYFRGQLERQVVNHRHALRVAAQAGVAMPSDVSAPRDAAHLGFRLASLLSAPERHPFPGDRRAALIARGVLAALTNPQLAWPNRLRRAAWFASCAVLPADRAVARTPDTPARRQVQPS